MENRKQKRWPFRLPLKKTGVIIFVVCLLSLSVASAATIHYISKAQSLKSNAHQTGFNVNTSSQQNTLLISSSAGQTPQSSISSSSADISVDFGNRQINTYPIPSTILGVGGVGLKLVVRNSSDAKAISQANFHLTKLGDYDFMSQIFPTAASANNPSQQNWTLFDTEMSLAATYSMQPLISLEYTPTWLQPQNQSRPQTNLCLQNKPPYDPHSSKPMYLLNGQDQGPQMWGRLAAQVVAHVDQHFRQSHAIYEIWNQPDGSQFLCTAPNDPNANQDRLNSYRAIFGAAAPLMQQQANRDGVQIKIGGPGLVYALKQHLTTWLPTLLNDPSIYPYMSFISYHVYLAGSNFNGGSNSLIASEQDPASGVTAQYEQIASIVHKGKQPNAKNTPIYIDEYSMSTCNNPVACQNDPKYSPLMNGLFVLDYLNSVRDTHSTYGAASTVPAGLSFYSWDIPLHHLCMFGVYDASMDCGIQNYPAIQPYPDYYAYSLLGGANYLNITDSGYVANAPSVKLAGVYANGFYTRTLDSIALVNTTSSDYQTLHIFLQNPGKVTANQANLYTLAFNAHSPGSSISTSHVNLAPVTGGGFMATVHLPAYTMIGISVSA
jgi:Glycosyl hydrolases family 39